MDPHDCAENLAAGFRNLGVLPGHTVLAHASFKSLGPVAGGMETVIQGLLRAVGTRGTLLMPALSWALRPPESFNARLTPTQAGAVPEYFRARKGVLRSVHPTHSVCAFGGRSREMLDDHGLDCTPCGPHSPFRKMAETHGKIVLLGCGLRPNTTMRALEEIANPPYLFGPSHVFAIIDPQGRACSKAYRTQGFAVHGYAQRYDRVMELDADSFMVRGPALEATAFVLDAPRLKIAVLEKMNEDPFFFVDALPDRAAGSGAP